MDNNTASFNAKSIASLVLAAEGPEALRALATFGYKGPASYSFEELCEIQDAAKEIEATL